MKTEPRRDRGVQRSGRASAPRWLLGAALSTALTGCELTEVTLAESEDVVIAEVIMQVGDGANRVTGFLHRTEDGSRGGGGTVPGAKIEVLILQRGLSFPLHEDDLDECLVPIEDPELQVEGTCYVASPLDELLLAPGDSVRLSIDLPDGGRLHGQTVVPGRFDIVSPPFARCALDAAETLELRWTASEGTWAYVAETLITGLGDVLEPEGIEVDDPLDLVGVSISASDTTIVFPSEFGVFERFDLDRDLALLLQEGLPDGITSTLIVGAVDRNWVNWVRGGNFNPSGQVRSPSIQGDGTGVFASSVRRTIVIETGPQVSAPPCDP
jgi:hypothetical protein